MPLPLSLILVAVAGLPDKVPPQYEFPARERRQGGAADHVAIATGDLDGDGYDDVVSTTAYARLRVWRGRLLGGLEPGPILQVDAPVVALDLGDVDGDGHLDVAFTTGGKVCVALGDGAAGFAAPTTIGFVTDGVTISAEDLDGNGLADVCVLSRAYGKLKAWLADGSGGFHPAVSSALAQGPEDFALGDLDLDGWVDAVVASTATGELVVGRGMGDGSFAPIATYTMWYSPATVSVGDLHEDGILDLATTGLFHAASYQLGLGNGVFSDPVNCGSDSRFELFDWDGDGADERIGFGGGVRYYPDLETCIWTEGPVLPVSSACSSLAPLDANGDGHLDLAFGAASLVDEFTGTGDDFTSVGVVLGDGSGGVLDIVRVRKDPEDGQNQLYGTADFDGDGFVDTIGLDPYADRVRVRLGTGAAGLNGPQELAVPGVNRMLLSDLDGDGDPDLVLRGELGLYTALNDAGTFPVPARVAPDLQFLLMSSGDVNDDGLEDVVFLSYQAGTYVRLSRGDGSFADPIPSPDVVFPGSASIIVRVADLDGDAFGDLVVTGWQSGIWTYRGTGNGQFVASGFVAPELYWTGFEVGDLDGDGLDDVVVKKAWACGCNLNSVLTFLCDGSGGLALHGEYEIGREIQNFRLHDMDGNGTVDLLAQLNKRVVAVSRGDGAGGFLQSIRYGAWGWLIGVGHADGNGLVDVVTLPMGTFYDDVELQIVLQR